MAPTKGRRGRVSLGSSVVRDRPACLECVDIKLVISVDCEIICEMLSSDITRKLSAIVLKSMFMSMKSMSRETLSSEYYICSGETRCDYHVISSGVRIVSGEARFGSSESLGKSQALEFGESREKPGSEVRIVSGKALLGRLESLGTARLGSLDSLGKARQMYICFGNSPTGTRNDV